MLAKEAKIKGIKRQRKFIEEQLKKAPLSKDGDPAYVYVGQLYPENIAYFGAEGYTIFTVKSEALTARVSGLPVQLFRVRDDVQVSEEELEEPEEPEEISEKMKAEASKLVDSLFADLF